MLAAGAKWGGGVAWAAPPSRDAEVSNTDTSIFGASGILHNHILRLHVQMQVAGPVQMRVATT